MPQTPVQIKRRADLAVPTSLLGGEFGLYSNGANHHVFIGSIAGSVIRIAGDKYSYIHQAVPGTLTANAAIITNGNNFVNDVKTNKLTLGADGATANLTSISTFANGTQLGQSGSGSNTEIVSSWAIKTYIDAAVAGGGGGATTLAALTDVDVTGVSNGQFLAFNGVSGAWGHRSITANSGQLVVTSNNTTTAIYLPNTVNVANIAAQHGQFTDVNISGNLAITGTLTYVDTQNLRVTDSLIALSSNNLNTDNLDIGFYGAYGNATVTSYTGLFRDATDNRYKLYTGLQSEPTTTVTVGGTGYAQATLEAYLVSGGFVSNATAINITANSTVSSTIAANTLTLSTPLVVGSGGTGRSTITAGAIMVGNAAGAVTMLTSSTEGHVLQINSTGRPIYGGIDCGTYS